MSVTPDTPDQSARDRHFIQKAIDHKVFEKVPVYPHEERDMSILLACGQFNLNRDKLTHLWERLGEPHLIALSGGGLRIDGGSPVNFGTGRPKSTVLAIAESIVALARRGVEVIRVLNMADYKCAMTDGKNMSVLDVLESHMIGKNILKERLRKLVGREIETALLFYDPQGDPEGGNGRTWFYQGKKMTPFISLYRDDPTLQFESAQAIA
jgi:hypothetical protein